MEHRSLYRYGEYELPVEILEYTLNKFQLPALRQVISLFRMQVLRCSAVLFIYFDEEVRTEKFVETRDKT